MKKLLLLILLSFGFIGSTHANVVTDLFFPKLEKYNNCIEDLKKQKINNKYQLCADKYAKKIDYRYIESGNHGGWSTGRFRIDVENKSNKYSIEKTRVKGYFYCKDDSECNRKYFDVLSYVTISPGVEKTIEFDASDTGVNLPSSIEKGEWSWYISSKEYFGFKIDY